MLDVLAAQEPCLGAFFSTFSFDPLFFENHVLRAVLRLASDPIEHPERYHQECRRALQQVPVAVITDAGQRQGGRRLPYDLLEVSATVFHPKTVLLLYRHHARLVVGSGNLTSGGYGGNVELFFHADLQQDQPADAGALAWFSAHLARLKPWLRCDGTQLALFEEALQRAIGDAADSAKPASFQLLDSTVQPILQQLRGLLPPRARLVAVGLAAPFFERDDDGDFDNRSVLGALLAKDAGQVDVDIAVDCDNVHLTPTDPAELAQGTERLWTWQSDGPDASQEHLVPISMGTGLLRYRNAQGQDKRCSVVDAHRAVERRQLWMQPTPVAHVPAKLFEATAGVARECRLWLHPSARLVEGRSLRRPLHAKLLALAYEVNGKPSTLLLMGSPNMSRRALLQAAGQGGNIEVAVALRLPGLLRLADLMPGIVRAPTDCVQMQEREFPATGSNHALAVERAVHDAKTGRLVVHWSDRAAALPAWALAYQGETLATASGPPAEVLTVAHFVLQPASAELTLRVGGDSFQIPILVSDLVHLPADATAPPLGLEELLLLAGRRLGTERVVGLAKQRAARVPPGNDLPSFLSDRFSPTDVFRAWWCVAEDLSESTQSVTAFRLTLEGATGTAAVWAAILGAARSRHLPAEEAWLYGAELLRTLSAVDLPESARRETAAKRAVLAAFHDRVMADLRSLLHGVKRNDMLRCLESFYVDGGLVAPGSAA
ncbi:MAG TPA: phospholipase D family protein [Aquabacterium sp.]|nr:phospholipase D family protein [Aquabacterium sp.]